MVTAGPNRTRPGVGLTRSRMWQRWRCSRPIASTRSAHLRPSTADAWSIDSILCWAPRWLIAGLAEPRVRPRVAAADHDVVGPDGPQAVASPGPAVRQPGQALDAGAAQDRAEQLGFGLATGDLDYDPVVHRSLPERERVGLGAGLEERDLQRPLADRFALAHELVQAPLAEQAVAVLVDVDAVGRRREPRRRGARGTGSALCAPEDSTSARRARGTGRRCSRRPRRARRSR